MADVRATPSFTRPERRKNSLGSGGMLRPEVFERLWCANATTNVWQRSLVPTAASGNKPAGLTHAERDAIRAAFSDDAASLGASETSERRHTVGLTSHTVDEGAQRLGASTTRQSSNIDLSPVPHLQSDADNGAIYVNMEGAVRVRGVIAKALRLTSLLSTHDFLQWLKAVCGGNGVLLSSTAPSIEWNKVRVDIDAVLAIADTLKREAASRRVAILSAPLGHPSGRQEDPFATPQEIVAAFTSLGGRSDLGGKASRDETLKLLDAASLDENVLEPIDGSLETSSSTQHKQLGGLDATATARSTASSLLGRHIDSSDHSDAVTHRSHQSRRSSTVLYESRDGSPRDDEDDDEEEPGLTFDDFKRVAAPVDPWKAVAARLFATLGGDPSDPGSTVSFDRVRLTYNRMLLLELPPDVATSFVDRLSVVLGNPTAVTFDVFEGTVVLTLRRVCAGGMLPADARRSQPKDGGPASGSAALIRMLTYQPTFGPNFTAAAQIAQRIDKLASDAKTRRIEYRRVRSKLQSIFKDSCILRITPLGHLVKLTRRRLLFFVNMVQQRRAFNMSAPNSVIERFLRCLTAAAHVLRDHAAQCHHCRNYASIVSSPAPSPPVAASPLRAMSPAVLSPTSNTITDISPPPRQRSRPPLHEPIRRVPKPPPPKTVDSGPWLGGGIATVVRHPMRRAETVHHHRARLLLPSPSSHTETMLVMSIFKRASLSLNTPPA